MKGLKETIVLTAIYYGRNLDQQVLEMMADDLSDLDEAECVAAYAQYRRNPANRTFPLPAQIRELVCPDEFIAPEIKAREVAARIVAAITKFGWVNGKEAAVYIGPDGWDVVARQGGWTYLCEHVGADINPAVLQAQLRDQLIGQFKHGKAVLEQSLGASSTFDRRTGSLEPAKGILSLITQGDPKEPA